MCYLGQWRGGWVRSSYALSYYNRDNERYLGSMKKTNPVPYALYEEMRSNGLWYGGWVNSYSILYYYSSSGVSYENSTGSQENPWPYNVYEEMTQNSTWDGGWIDLDSGNTQYIPELSFVEGSGISNNYTGSGNSSVFGPGLSIECAIDAGSTTLGTIKNGAIRVDISWSEGGTFGFGELSHVDLDFVSLDSSYEIREKRCNARWVAPYEATIEGSFTYYKDEVLHECFITEGSFVIPQEYRVNPDDDL